MPGNPVKSVLVIESGKSKFLKMKMFFSKFTVDQSTKNMNCSKYFCEEIVNHNFYSRM